MDSDQGQGRSSIRPRINESKNLEMAFPERKLVVQCREEGDDRA